MRRRFALQQLPGISNTRRVLREELLELLLQTNTL
jgi:hypothetical protein